MREIDIEIDNAIWSSEIDMLYFILENIIRNVDIDAFNYLIINVTDNNMYDFFVDAINSINLNQNLPDIPEAPYEDVGSYTIASNYISWIKHEISGRHGEDPEIFRPYINAIFDTYIDMDAGEVSINDVLEITEPGITNENWCKNTIRDMIDDKINKENMYRQSKSLVSSLNPVLGMDSPLNYLDIDTMDKLYSSMILSKPDISRKINNEYTLDPLVKANQKLAFAKGFSDPNSSVKIREDHLRDDIGKYVSRHRPYPSVQKRFMLENKPKTKKSRKFAKRTTKNRKKRNRY